MHLGYHGNGCHFDFFSTPKSCHILRWIFLQSFMKFDERNQFFLIPPFFVSMATVAKFVQSIPIFFGLSRSTRCECCSYQVSAISVWRVTCYDHFCVFQFFSILVFPWQRQPFWKNQPLIPILCKDLNWQEMHSLRIQLMLSIFLKYHKKWWKMLQNICNKCRFPWQPAQIFRVWKI